MSLLYRGIIESDNHECFNEQQKQEHVEDDAGVIVFHNNEDDSDKIIVDYNNYNNTTTTSNDNDDDEDHINVIMATSPLSNCASLYHRRNTCSSRILHLTPARKRIAIFVVTMICLTGIVSRCTKSIMNSYGVGSSFNRNTNNSMDDDVKESIDINKEWTTTTTTTTMTTTTKTEQKPEQQQEQIKHNRKKFPQEQEPFSLTCIGDRLQHEKQRLSKGEYLCSKSNLFVMGLSASGSLLWMDLNTSESKVYYDRSSNRVHANNTNTNSHHLHHQPNHTATPATYPEEDDHEYFILRENGNFMVFFPATAKEEKDDRSSNTNNNNNNHTDSWTKEIDKEKYGEITSNKHCLPDYDCPYLHLHGDGVIVLNWIDAITGQWMEKNINKIYNF